MSLFRSDGMLGCGDGLSCSQSAFRPSGPNRPSLRIAYYTELSTCPGAASRSIRAADPVPFVDLTLARLKMAIIAAPTVAGALNRGVDSLVLTFEVFVMSPNIVEAAG